MRQTARVTALLPDGRAELTVLRQSACTGDCGSCGGCGFVQQRLSVTAENPIHAQAGDLVHIESETASVLKAAALVYLLPLALFLGGYLLSLRLGNWAYAVGLAGFVLGLLPAFVYNCYRKRKPIKHRIVGFVK